MVGLPFAVLLNIVLDFALGCAFLSCHHGCICYFWIPNIQHKFSHAAGRDYKNKETSRIGLERIAKSVFDFVECLRLRFCGKPMFIRVKQWNSDSEPKWQIRMRSIRLGPGGTLQTSVSRCWRLGQATNPAPSENSQVKEAYY
jgi:hypothetical protein